MMRSNGACEATRGGVLNRQTLGMGAKHKYRKAHLATLELHICLQ